MILSDMAENSMPHYIIFASVLVDLARACSQDPKAFAEVHLSASSAAYFYKSKYGLAKTVMESLLLDLQCNPFSLKIDKIKTHSFSISIGTVKIHANDT